MGFWAKSLRIFKCLCDNGKQSVRRIAQQTGFSKSSVHRLTAGDGTPRYPPGVLVVGNGRRPPWFIRLVVATLYTFGLKRGVGLDTMQRVFRSSAP